MSSLGNVLILGDSYSTFEGWIPGGYTTWYPQDTVPNITCVEQTWWHRLLIETDSRLVRNESYSGTTVCNTGYDGSDTSDSFIKRVDRLIAASFFKKCAIDTVFVLGGQNDEWANAPIGTMQYGGWRQEDLLCFAPAYCYLLDCLKTTLPKARIICLENMYLNGTIRKSIETACRHYRVDLIRLREISTVAGHPDCRGMEQISNQIQLYLLCT